MRLATVVEDGRHRVARIVGDRFESLTEALSTRQVLELEPAAVSLLTFEPSGTIDAVTFGPAVPEPGAIYTIGANYRPAGTTRDERPERPMVLGKLPSSVSGHADTVAWDRAVTANVEGECELGVVIGRDGGVFGYTIVNDMNSVDPWLDGVHWLLGKSMAGFCPVGPWIVTADELDPGDLRLGSAINGEPIQDGRTSDMRFSIPEVIDYIGRHVALRPGDLIATGTPARLATPPGPDRHLEPGDSITCWIDGVGELTTHIR